MPCYDNYVGFKYTANVLQIRANEATRAACEMARLIREKDIKLLGKLTLTTQKWIRNHEKLDSKRSK